MSDDEREEFSDSFLGGRKKSELADDYGQKWITIHRAVRELNLE